MNSLIEYFIRRHLVANVIFFGVIILAIFAWKNIGKEEMPEFESNWVRITTIYPGAPAEDVELFVTKPMEDELKGVVGIEEIDSTSSVGISSFRIVIDDYYPDKDEVVQEIKDAVLRVDLPSEVRDLPKIRQFKSAEKAIMDIGLYYKGQQSLDTPSRQALQTYVLGFENQMLAMSEVSSIDRSHYRKPELQILVDPEDKRRLQFSLSEIRDQIIANNVRVPIGSMEDKGESKVTALNELETVESLEDLILRGNYEGNNIRLGDMAKVQQGFEKTNSIFKINAHEGIFLNIKKSISTDILSAKNAVMKFIDDFKRDNKDSPLGIVIMDDESFDVTNRLSIISSNGILGFVLILIVLLIFLDLKSGFWVAMGIPFSMGFTLIFAGIAGYTVNNMTLAGIIIVLGIVVDDAIIIAENISRHREEGKGPIEASIVGTKEVFTPIIASIITTCVAFIPLAFFEGFFGKLVAYIPLIVILMLLGSLVESLFVLPAHMSSPTPLLERFSNVDRESWFRKYENKYESFLMKCFQYRTFIISLFLVLLISGGYLFKAKMKFVMFPREESKEVLVKVSAPIGTTRNETSKIIEPLEEFLASDTDNVVGVRTSVALSRRGGEVKENEATILIEVKPADQRNIPLNKLLTRWEEKAKNIKEIEKAKFLKGRWGHSSGSAIEIQIQENNDASRKEIAEFISNSMKKYDFLSDVEIEKPLQKREYLFKLKQNRLIKYSVSPSKVTSTLRSFVEGSILYSINKGEEEVDVRLSVPDKAKYNLDELLNLRVENQAGQLTYLRKIVDIEEVERPTNIKRSNFKRATMIYGDLAKNTKITPLQVAERLESEVFPSIKNKYPTSIITFKGEIEDSRESQGEFANSILIVIFLIYFILLIMFNSWSKPFLVLSIVPFGLAGVIFVLIAHGSFIYGFFATIGALGMIGVVINDAIVMIDKIDQRKEVQDVDFLQNIAHVASTRLRPVLVTTLTTVVGILPTAYGVLGFDSMLAEMMLTMGWGLAFGTVITLILIPVLYSFTKKSTAHV